MERIAVTGGHGLLGRYVVAALESDYEVTVVDRIDGGSHQPMGPVDVLELDRLQTAVDGQDAVVHLAALDAAVNASDEEFFRSNTLAAWNVLHAGYEAGIRKFVICSSTSIYGIREQRFPSLPLYLPIDEAHPARSNEAYGLSKRVSELIGQGFAERPGYR